MLVNYIFRNKNKGGFSIEELFESIGKTVASKIEVSYSQLPYSNFSWKSIVSNIKHVNKIKGIIHITGDTHYVGIIPFKKTVLTIHDVDSVIRGNWFSRTIKKMLWFWLPALCVKKITVISNFTKHQVLAIIPWAKSKVTVIYNPVNPLLETQLKKELNAIPVILHLGTKANKNLERTIIGLKDIPCKLVIIGTLNKEQLEVLKACKTDFENYNNLTFESIKAQYQNADIVSFISLYEGFGMPIIEAQKVGRVVITSDRASIPEIAMDSVHYVNPLDVTSINEGFKKIISDNSYRQSLIIKGLDNVKRFDINNISQQYLAIYKSLVNEN